MLFDNDLVYDTKEPTLLMRYTLVRNCQHKEKQDSSPYERVNNFFFYYKRLRTFLNTKDLELIISIKILKDRGRRLIKSDDGVTLTFYL